MPLALQNFLLFQAGWFSCVLGGASNEYSWAGVVVVAAIIAVHLKSATSMRDEMVLIAITMVLGTAWDSGLMLAGLFSFTNGLALPGIAPFWLIAMWALFATTLNVSMSWMKQRYFLAAVFGAIGGPLAYYAGNRIGAVEFGDTSTALLAVGAGWAVIMPFLMALTVRFNGFNGLSQGTAEVRAV